MKAKKSTDCVASGMIKNGVDLELVDTTVAHTQQLATY